MSRTPSLPVTPSPERRRVEHQLAHEKRRLDSLRVRIANLQRLANTLKLLRLIQGEAKQLQSEPSKADSKADRQRGYDIIQANTSNTVVSRARPILKRAATDKTPTIVASRTRTDVETAPSLFTYTVGSSGQRTQQTSDTNVSFQAGRQDTSTPKRTHADAQRLRRLRFNTDPGTNGSNSHGSRQDTRIVSKQTAIDEMRARNRDRRAGFATESLPNRPTHNIHTSRRTKSTTTELEECTIGGMSKALKQQSS